MSSWSFRLMQHEKFSDVSYFITLTYDSKYVPVTEEFKLGLCRSDLQKFWKRLRKAHESESDHGSAKPIKYFAVGEYGGITERPHYHAIVFNAKLKLIEQAWPLGNIHVGNVTGASVGYTLLYMQDKEAMKQQGREPVFQCMSKGLGLDYLTPAMVKWHKAKLWDRMYCVTDQQQKISMPRYYKEKLYTEQERKVIAAKARIKKEAEDLFEEFYSEGWIEHQDNEGYDMCSFVYHYDQEAAAPLHHTVIEGVKANFQRLKYKSKSKIRKV